MADFSPAGAAETASFTNGKRRKIIMVDKSFFVFFFQPVNGLFFARRAESDGGKGLGIAAIEKR